MSIFFRVIGRFRRSGGLRVPGVRAALLAALVLLAGQGSRAADPAPPAASQREPLPIRAGESQMWLISTRALPGQLGACADRSQFEVYCFKHSGGAVLSSFEEFVATSDPRLVTVIFVHGNGLEAADSVSEGSQFCRSLCGGSDRPMRFVIWSWPSQHQQHWPRADLRVKLTRTNAEVFYLANTIEALPTNSSLCLIGFSFGSRIVSGALHLLGGGSIDGHMLPSSGRQARPPIRALLLSGAMDADSLLPNGSNGLALSQVDRVLVTVNPEDCALRLYPLLRGDSIEALGLVGVPAPLLGTDPRIAQVDVSRYVGRHHAFRWHLQVPEFVSLVRYEIMTAGQATPAASEDPAERRADAAIVRGAR